MNPNTEIRRLRPAELYTLARILAASDSWKTLMAVVPKEGSENEPKFNSEHFALIERASFQQRKSGAEIFLEEWSTMGKRRPTLKSTLDLLVKVELFRAADYIAVDLLQREPPERPTYGPAARFQISDEEIARLMKEAESELEVPDPQAFDSRESLDNVLDGLGYPSGLSLSPTGQNTIQNIESDVNHQPAELIEEMSTLRISMGPLNHNNSNLMEFSKSDVESRVNNVKNSRPYNNSNLMQFSSNSIRSSNIANLEEQIFLDNGVRNPHVAGVPQALLMEENSVRVWNSSDTNTFSNAGVISNSNNCSTFELHSSELPAFVADIGKGSVSMYSEVKTSELPQFVVDIAQEVSNRSESTTNTEPFGEPFLSKYSFNSSSDSSNYTNNGTSPSDNNTESIIPLCVNSASGSSENNELVSAELPQFVADLGHRHTNDNYGN